MSELIVGRPMATPSNRVLTTLLFTDIVDSTQHLSAMGDRRWREVLDRHDHMVQRQLGRFDGKLIKTTGDGFLATFDGPGAGRSVRPRQVHEKGHVNWTSRQARRPPHRRSRAPRRGHRGLAVHVCQRISSVAEGDEILVSRTIVDLVAGSDLAFDARGEHQLRGLTASWPIFAVAAATEGRSSRYTGAGKSRFVVRPAGRGASHNGHDGRLSTAVPVT